MPDLTLIERAAAVLEVHQLEWIDHEVGWECGCNEHGTLPSMRFRSDAEKHQAEMVLAAVRSHIAAEVLGEAADEAHETARRYDGRTQVGRAARDVAGVVIDRWHAADNAARRARRG